MAKENLPPPPVGAPDAKIEAWITQYLKGNTSPTSKEYTAAWEALRKARAEDARDEDDEKTKIPLTPSQMADLFVEQKLADAGEVPLVDPFARKLPQRTVASTLANIKLGATSSGGKPRERGRPGGVGIAQYGGENLVDENGNITSLLPYERNNVQEAYAFLSTFDDTVTLVNILKKYNYYGNSGPSAAAKGRTGFQSQDYAAVSTFLDKAGDEGLTGKAWLQKMQETMAVNTGGSGTAAVFTSREDSALALRSAAFKYLGRALTSSEMDAAVQAIATNERARTGSSGGEQSATIGTAARLQVEQAAPAEAGQFTLGAAMDRLTQLMGG